MKRVLLLLLLTFYPVAASGADDAQSTQNRPHWSLELKGGLFYPAIGNWKQFYGDDSIPQYGLAFSYKILRMLEFGIEGDYIRDNGQGFAPTHGTVAGNVTYQLYPVNVFVLIRGVINENQWFVPYVGGGYTYMYYREQIQYQSTISGHTDGIHGRAGLQFLLDGLDQSAANSFYRDIGVYHTYLFGEVQYCRALVNTSSGSVNLGGWSYIGGLLFEF